MTNEGRWHEQRTAGVSFISGAVAGGVVKTCTAPLSRSTILLQTAQSEIFASSVKKQKFVNSYSSFMKQSFGYLGSVYTSDGLLSFWKGNGASILQKMATTGSNYMIYDRLKIVLRPIWASETDVGFSARLFAGVLSGAFNITVAYPLDLARTNIASIPAGAKRSQWAGIANTLSMLRATHGQWFLTRGLLCTQICQGLNVGLHFGVYETMALTRNIFFDPKQNTDKQRAPRTSFLHSCLCGSVAGLIASTITQPLDLIRRRQQIAGNPAGDKVFLQVAIDIARRDGIGALYRGIIPELIKVVLFPASGVNFFVYEFVRQDIFGERTGVR